jgi:glc operon protein GlcG
MKQLSPPLCIAGILCGLALFPLGTFAQQPEPPGYGAPISLEQAKKIVAGADAEARKNRWNVVITVVDSGGHLVLLQRHDSTQIGSLEVARKKAVSAVQFRRPTKSFADALAMGGDGLRVLKVDGAMPIDGGLPIVREGKIIGGVGVSGVTPQQDGQIAQAGADALK